MILLTLYNILFAALFEASSDIGNSNSYLREKLCYFSWHAGQDPGGMQLSLFIVAIFSKHMFTATVAQISAEIPTQRDIVTL